MDELGNPFVLAYRPVRIVNAHGLVAPHGSKGIT